MRKIRLLSCVLLITTFVNAQNFQLHYDFGKGRNYLTSTFEMFKPDKWGNTFMFVDIDYNMDKEHHPSLAYTEIARCFTLWKSPFSAQIEYNGGLFAIPAENGNTAYAINNCYLAGLDYGWSSADFSKFLNLKLLYKYIAGEGKNPLSFQITGVWTLNFFDDKLTLSGFADFWRENNTNFYRANGVELESPSVTKFVFQSEPQFWYNITPNFSVGSEVELGVNFAAVQGLKICPTVGVKWTFL